MTDIVLYRFMHNLIHHLFVFLFPRVTAVLIRLWSSWWSIDAYLTSAMKLEALSMFYIRGHI